MKLIANSLLYIYLNAFKCNFVSFWVGNNLAYIAICSAPNSALHIYQLIEINFSDKTSQTQMQRWSLHLKFRTRTRVVVLLSKILM